MEINTDINNIKYKLIQDALKAELDAHIKGQIKASSDRVIFLNENIDDDGEDKVQVKPKMSIFDELDRYKYKQEWNKLPETCKWEKINQYLKKNGLMSKRKTYKKLFLEGYFAKNLAKKIVVEYDSVEEEIIKMKNLPKKQKDASESLEISEKPKHKKKNFLDSTSEEDISEHKPKTGKRKRKF
jgi:hypothetical protein